MLEKVLADFKIKGEVIEISVGISQVALLVLRTLAYQKAKMLHHFFSFDYSTLKSILSVITCYNNRSRRRHGN